jgi:UDP-N-acetylglucosamine 2-epimerase (non-hydrolysing)
MELPLPCFRLRACKSRVNDLLFWCRNIWCRNIRTGGFSKVQILHVVGARPNFMKAAPVFRAFAQQPGVSQTLVHTGQHYDVNMSDVFFRELAVPEPDVNLRVGSGSHAQQTGEVMMRLEPVVLERKPDWVFVYGDVNSTAAATMVCSKLLVKVAHVEAGLRSFDRTMPEEINRLVTDQLANLLFTPSQDGNDNLLREGIAPERIRLVGNVMIDTLVQLLPRAHAYSRPGLPEQYALVTLHRPSNVDDPVFLQDLFNTLLDLSREVAIIFPVHPRTRQRIAALDSVKEIDSGLQLTCPLSYLEFLSLQAKATVVITDSGGIQEETTFLNVPCITVRENTERPVTTTLGTNVLVGRDMKRLREEAGRVLKGRRSRGEVPPLWDGKASLRIVQETIGAGPQVHGISGDLVGA